MTPVLLWHTKHDLCVVFVTMPVSCSLAQNETLTITIISDCAAVNFVKCLQHSAFWTLQCLPHPRLPPTHHPTAVRRSKRKFNYNGVQFLINKGSTLKHSLARSLSTTIIIIICSYPKLRVPSKPRVWPTAQTYYFVCLGFGHSRGFPSHIYVAFLLSSFNSKMALTTAALAA